MADFIPKRNPELHGWLTSLKQNLPEHAADFELTPARLAEVMALVEAHLEAITLVGHKKAEWKAAAAIKRLQSRTTLATLRKEIARWKTASGAGNGGLAALRLSATLPAVDADNLQPELIATVTGGHVRLRFKKRGAKDVNLYVRSGAKAEWRLLSRASRSPYVDQTPPAVPGQPELREYHAVGVVHDREIGRRSDIVSVTFAG